ncbi:MAG TPA: hypothetical protein VF033_08220 [Steroidobacteraceae bacterium]|jgi:hypothetical protein
MTQVIDHLWQSTLFVALVSGWTAMLARHSARLRLWLWRVAALKFVVPFAVFFELGAWLGFPVRHSAIAPPPLVVGAVDSSMPFAAPAQTLAAGSVMVGVELLCALLLTGVAAWWIARNLRVSTARYALELARTEADWAHVPPAPGFLKTLALAGGALILVVAPVVGGALRDRQWRQQSLAVDSLSLRDAAITLTETDWRFGDRTQVFATADGVVIRKINLQDLVAMVYGIGQFEVYGGALPWLESPHYDLRVRGPIHTPAAFDPYSLREPVTNYLSREYGVAIRVNGACQDPCVNQQSITVERLPWTLLDKLRRSSSAPD